MAEIKKCVPGKISREAYRALEDIVGPSTSPRTALWLNATAIFALMRRAP